jgi:DNA repair exonuclease SbcCD nuclease subunit
LAGRTVRLSSPRKVYAMFRILHISDPHLRDAQYARLVRGLDFFEAFKAAVEAGIRLKVDAIANTGDVFNSSRPSSRTFAQLKEIGAMLQDAGIPMLTLTGNHDKSDPSWLEMYSNEREKGGIKCMDGRRFALYKGDESLVFQGLCCNGADALRDDMADCSPAGVLMWHGAVKEFCGFPVDYAISEEEFPLGKFGTILLGDIHVCETHKLADGTTIGYPGSTELCSSSEDECKYGLLYSMDSEGAVSRCEKVPVPSRRVVRLAANTEEDMPEILGTLRACSDMPLVFVRYNRGIPHALERMRKALGPDQCILRATPVADGGSRDMESEAGRRASFTVEDMVPELVPAGTREFELALKLSRREFAAFQDAIDDYVNERLGLCMA